MILFQRWEGASSTATTLHLRRQEHFESVQQASDPGILLILFYGRDKEKSRSILATTPDKDFAEACKLMGMKVVCAAVDYNKDTAYASELYNELTSSVHPNAVPTDFTNAEHVKQHFPQVLMLKNAKLETNFYTEVTLESLVYHLNRFFGPRITAADNAGKLKKLVEEDLPFVLAYFPAGSQNIRSPYYAKYQYWVSLSNLAYRRLLFVQVSDAAILPPAIIDAEEPRLLLVTDHWPNRLVPDEFWTWKVEDSATWLVERSRGSALSLTKEGFQQVAQSLKPMFLIWIDHFRPENEPFMDLAHILSFYFSRYLNFGVVSMLSEANKEYENGHLVPDYGPNYFGISRADLPKASILVPTRNATMAKFLYQEQQELELPKLKQWIVKFLKRELPISFKSQEFASPDEEVIKDIHLLSFRTWKPKIVERQQQNWVVALWSSDYQDHFANSLKVFSGAASFLKPILPTTFFGSYDIAKNDLPPTIPRLERAIELSLYLSQKDGQPDKVLPFPPHWQQWDQKTLASWVYFRIAEHDQIIPEDVLKIVQENNIQDLPELILDDPSIQENEIKL